MCPSYRLLFFISAYPERIRQHRLSVGETLGIARSLPLSVPIHKHPLLSKTDQQDEFSDIAGNNIFIEKNLANLRVMAFLSKKI